METPELMSDQIRTVLRAGRWESGEARVLPQILEPGERVVDLGACIGFLSALIGLQRRAQTIVAFEANPELIPLIERVLALNRVDAIVRNGLVSQARGAATAPFYLHKDLWASSPIRVKDSARRGVVDLPVVSLQEMVAELAPTLVIIDLEVMRGFLAEAAASPGARLDFSGLSGVGKILTELKASRFSHAEIKAVFDAFSAAGFAYDPARSQAELVVFRPSEPRGSI
jgi:FkbM family methyltransferase